MQRDDDRTPEQHDTHRWAAVGTDTFLSGWGKAEGGASYAAWACTAMQLDACRQYVESRSDMKRVRVVDLNEYRPRGTGHLHVYVYDPAINV